MRSIDGFSGDTLRTFTDGGFYAMNVAPGIYTLTVDPSQLQFLQAVQKDGPLSVTVHHTPQGDIIENLEIALTKLAAENYVAPPKQVPVEAAPEKKKIIEKAPPPENKKPENKKPEIKKPEIAPQQSAPKPKETVCTVVFVAAKRIFVIEHSRWPTKAAADEVAARLAKRTNLPATVRKGTSETGRASYSVLLGAFQSRRAAEEACAKLNGTK